jgi:hypothetical protein
MEGGFDLDSPEDDWMHRIGEPDRELSRDELVQQESLAYHKMSIARTEYESAHADYVRIADRLNDLKMRESRKPYGEQI